MNDIDRAILWAASQSKSTKSSSKDTSGNGHGNRLF